MGTAATAETGADDIAAQVAAAAPTAEIVQPAEVSGNFVAVSDDVTVEFPNGGNGHLSFTAPAIADLELSLPPEAVVGTGSVARDGTVAYSDAGGGASVAVQALDDGAVRIQTVSHDAEASTTFTYTFGEHVVLKPNHDGSVAITEVTPRGSVVTYGLIEAPWATDAAGAVVATRYEVDGNVLTQSITTDATTTYPVVADPKLTFGTRIYWALTRTEQLYFGSMGAWAAAAYLCAQTAGLSCAATAAAATAIGLYLSDRGGACPTSAPWLQVGFPYGYPLNTYPAPSITCRVSV